MSKCSSKFRAAVKKVAKRDSYDLVTALGVVTPTGDAPGVKDITIDVIAAIEN
jgi:Skp family chaperone for outer membrane proteins